MRYAVAVGLFLLVAPGCAAVVQPQVAYPNPVLLPATDRDLVWSQVVDVVDDYFEIEREQRVRQLGDALTIGRIDTLPLVGATYFEPWHGDSASRYERMESTLQSMRRRALVQVIPSEGGYLVDVAVFKELEDMSRPENSTVGVATFRYQDSLDRLSEPVGPQPVTEGWIPQGRDPALEQRMIRQLVARFAPHQPLRRPPIVPQPTMF